MVPEQCHARVLGWSPEVQLLPCGLWSQALPSWRVPWPLPGGTAGHLALIALLCVKFLPARTSKARGLQFIFENKTKQNANS